MKLFNLRTVLFVALLSIAAFSTSWADTLRMTAEKGGTFTLPLVRGTPDDPQYLYLTMTNTSGATLTGEWVLMVIGDSDIMSIDYTPDKKYPDLCKRPLGPMPDKATCTIRLKITGTLKHPGIGVVQLKP